MLSIRISGKAPIYEEIANQIEEMVLTDVVEEDEQLPSIRELANDLAVNPNTIQKAYSELENRGITYSLYGKGIFITHDVDAIKRKKLATLLRQIEGKMKLFKITGGKKSTIMELSDTVFYEKGEEA